MSSEANDRNLNDNDGSGFSSRHDPGSIFGRVDAAGPRSHALGPDGPVSHRVPPDQASNVLLSAAADEVLVRVQQGLKKWPR